MFGKMVIYLIYIMQNSQRQPLKHEHSQQITKIIHNSNFSTFHLKLIIFFMLTSFFNNFQLNSSRLFYMNPAFTCQGIQGKQTEQYACRIIDSCKIINNESITAQLRLYCDSSSRILIQSSVGIGDWIGVLFSTIISDRMGRKFCFILAFAFLNVSWIIQYIGITQRIIILLSLSQIILGLSINIIYINFLILSSRFIGKYMNEIVTVGWFIAPNVGIIAISIINSQYQNWKVLFYIYSAAIAILSIFSFFVLYQDPVYYFDIGQDENCKDIIREISIQNGKEQMQILQNQKKLDKFIENKLQRVQMSGKILNYYKVLCNCSILSYVAILGVVAICTQMSGLSATYSMQGLKLSYNQNLFITGVSNIIGYVTAIFVIKFQENRKRGIILSTFICSVAGLAFGFQFCTQNQIVQSICMSVFRVSSCWISCFYVRLKVDLPPQKYQGCLIGVIQFIANFGRVISPSFVDFSTRNSLNPIFSASILNLTFGSFPLFFLSQKKIHLEQKQQKSQQNE